MELGSYPTVTLAMARERAREAAESVWRGVDPIEAKASRRRVLRFSEAMEQFLQRKPEEYENDKHRKQWRATLDNYAAPVLGDMSVADIAVQDVVRTLSPIWTTKTVTAMV